MTQSLYEKYRPKTFDDVIGQDAAVKMLKNMVKDKKVPHCILFTGPSGTGKTTLAYVTAAALGMQRDLNLTDINCGVVEPMETVRSIANRVADRGGPLTSKRIGWVFDEFQAFSRAGYSQQATLKMFEQPPNWAYFFLCSTDPQKIIPTVRSRCFEIKLNPLSAGSIGDILSRCASSERFKLAKVVQEKIENCVDSSARLALVMLEKVMALDSEKDQLAAIEKEAGAVVGFNIAQYLFKTGNWNEMSKMLQQVEGEESESIRRVILGYAKSILLKNPRGRKRAEDVIDQLRDHTYDGGFPVLCRMISSLYK